MRSLAICYTPIVRQEKLETSHNVRNVTLIAVIMLTIAAYALRVIGAESSVVYSEDPQLVRQSLEMGQSIANARDLTADFPESFKYPLTLTYYLTVIYGSVYGIGRALSVYSSASEFQAFLFANRELVYVLAVWALNLISVALIPVIFFAQRRLKVGISGWLAAGLASFNLLLVHFGHQPSPHTPLATLSFCAIVLLVMVAHNYGSWRLILLATTVSALVVGTLQSGILICLPYALAILARPYRHGQYNWRRLFGLQTVVSLLLFA